VIRRTIRPVSRDQRGFTLIELMVSLVLGLLLILGVISVYLTNQQAARTNEGLARLQESGRIAFELMSRELRQAGGNACGARLLSNVLNNPAANWFTDFDAGSLRGFDGDQDSVGIVAIGNAVGQRVADTDAVIIMSPSATDNAIIVSHDPATTTFTLNTVNHGVSTNNLVLVCDQQSAAIVRITAASPGTTNTIVHGVGAAVDENCVPGLGFPRLCAGTGTPKTFTPGGLVATLNPGFWYIGNNPRGGRSLYRADSNGTAEEITDGVVDMQLRYLTRDAVAGTLETDWVDADAILDWSDAGADLPVAMRIQLSLETLQSVGTDQQPLRRQQVHAVTLRNRSL
jgi:type IV pilus assembly protein PilW